MKYAIDLEGQYYSTLREIKDHIWLQSDKDRQNYNRMQILCYKGSNYIGYKEIKIQGKKIVFSRTIKAQSWE